MQRIPERRLYGCGRRPSRTLRSALLAQRAPHSRRSVVRVTVDRAAHHRDQEAADTRPGNRHVVRGPSSGREARGRSYAGVQISARGETFGSMPRLSRPNHEVRLARSIQVAAPVRPCSTMRSIPTSSCQPEVAYQTDRQPADQAECPPWRARPTNPKVVSCKTKALPESQNGPLTCAFAQLVAGAGFEPATFGL